MFLVRISYSLTSVLHGKELLKLATYFSRMNKCFLIAFLKKRDLYLKLHPMFSNLINLMHILESNSPYLYKGSPILSLNHNTMATASCWPLGLILQGSPFFFPRTPWVSSMGTAKNKNSVIFSLSGNWKRYYWHFIGIQFFCIYNTNS